jgi:DNA modification methylase
MSTQLQPSTVETVTIEQLRETEGPRFDEIDPDHVADLKESIDLEGLIEPIVVAASDAPEYSHDIVDGRHRKRALVELGIDEVAVYEMPGGRDYAVPTKEAQVDVEIQSMAANVLRKEQTQAEEARFLKENIANRVIDEFSDEELSDLGNRSDTNDASARVTQSLQLIDYLENISNSREEWKFADEHYQELKRIRSAVGIGKPKTEAEHIRFYTDSPSAVVEAWENKEITKQYVKHLRQIEQDNLRTHALEQSTESGEEGYVTRDLRKIKKAASYDAPETHEQIINGEFEHLEDAVKQAKEEKNSESDEGESEDDEPDSPTEDEIAQFKQQLEDEGYLDKTETVADWVDKDQSDVVKQCYQTYDSGEDYQQELDEAVAEIEEKKAELQRVRTEQVDSYCFNETPFRKSTDDGEIPHKEAPLALDENGMALDDSEGFGLSDLEVATFFHDNLQMDLEIPDSLDQEAQDGFFHLMFFSPPYFDQSGSMPVDEWLPEGTAEIADEETLDTTYGNYLNWLIERLKVFTQKLKPGRALIVNISDISTANLSELDAERFGSAPKKRYNIPAGLSARVRRDIDELQYDSTIQWMRQQTTSQRGGQYWSKSSATESGDQPEPEDSPKSGYPLYYYPQDATEELLIFRKNGKPNHSKVRKEAMSRFDKEFNDETEFQLQVGIDDPRQPFSDCLDELAGDFDDPRNNVWKIAPQSDESSHKAAFPRKLARLVIKLFTLPGERVADPFGGYATTLREVQKVNADQPEQPNRQGFAWENFSSEQVGQEDYRSEVYEVLSEKGIASYRQPL